MACLLADTDNDADREAALIDELRSRRCEGLVIASAARVSPAVEALARDDVADRPRHPRRSTRRRCRWSRPTTPRGVRAAVAASRASSATRGSPTSPARGPVDDRARRAAVRARAGRTTGPVVVHGAAFTVAAGERACAALLAAHARRDRDRRRQRHDRPRLLRRARRRRAALPGRRVRHRPQRHAVRRPGPAAADHGGDPGARARRAGGSGACWRGCAARTVESVRLPTELILRASTAAPARA